MRYFMSCSSIFIVNFEHVIPGWDLEHHVTSEIIPNTTEHCG